MRERQTLTRRSLVVAAPVAIAAVSLPAIAANVHPAAGLLALRSTWLDANAAFEATFDPLAAAERRLLDRMKREPHHDRATVERETGFAQADEEQRRTCHAQWQLADRIFDMPATTVEGVRFKLEILKAFEGCDTSSFESLLKRDLLQMAGVYDA